MKVIKHGSTYRKIQCCNCGCVYCFSENDVCSEGYDCFVSCPECDMETNIELSEQTVSDKEQG